MNQAEFLSGAHFRHKKFPSYTYQYGQASFMEGYLWQIIPGGRRHCVATMNEVGELEAVIDLIVLGQYMMIRFKYEDFEIIEP